MLTKDRLVYRTEQENKKVIKENQQKQMNHIG